VTLAMFGISNCDTVKKARTWLDGRGIAYTFHDYKKEGADAGKVAAWIAARGVDTVLNRRGTTFRKLSDAERAQAESDPVALMVAQPSCIKRPVVECPGGVLVGFDAAEWGRAFS
jgi:arsenate reductase